MKLSIVLACSLIVAFNAPAWAVPDKNGKVFLYNSISCGKYLDERKTNYGSSQQSFYLGGFLSAYNLMASDTADIANGKDMEGMMAWVDKYCRNHPLDTFQMALTSLVGELYPNRELLPAPKEKH